MKTRNRRRAGVERAPHGSTCLLTAASLHDSQVAIPLANVTAARVTNLYDVMDSAYDVPEIRDHSRSLGHVPIIDVNPRSTRGLKEELQAEEKRRRRLGHSLAEEDPPQRAHHR